MTGRPRGPTDGGGVRLRSAGPSSPRATAHPKSAVPVLAMLPLLSTEDELLREPHGHHALALADLSSVMARAYHGFGGRFAVSWFHSGDTYLLAGLTPW